MSVPSSTSRIMSGQCLSWMTFYWLALGVAVLLNTYSDVVLLQPYRYYSHYNYGDDAPWTVQHQQQHVSISSLKTPLSNETITTSAITATTTTTTTTTTNHHHVDIGGNDNNEKMKTILEILSVRRNAFYQNTTLRAMLQANPECHGKEELLSILYAATADNGGSFSSSLQAAHNNVAQFLQDSCSKLAPWKQVTDLYGTKPIVVGMETCATYRNMLSNIKKSSSASSSSSPRVRVAGLYNSGTTALAHALVDNLPRTEASATAAGSDLEEQIRLQQGQKHDNTNININNNNNNDNNNNSTTTTNNSIIISPGVPWGKHLPLKYKYMNTFPPDNTDDPDLVLPIVVVRDPYRWMQSMCKTAYDAEWTLLTQHCPNLVPTAYELKTVNDSSFFPQATTTMSPNNNNNNNSSKNVKNNVKKTYKVNVTYEMAGFQYGDVYPSLADWWSEWISAYVDSSAPRLLIRFEDLLFHAEYVMAQIIECVHGSISINSSSSSGSIAVAAAASSQSSSSLSSLLKPYDYKLTKAKTHGRSTDFVGAILKYARQDTKRSGGMTAQDLAFARGGDKDDDHDHDDKNGGSSNINNNKTSSTSSSSTAPLYPKLMQMFFYTHPPANTPLRIQYRLMNVPS